MLVAIVNAALPPEAQRRLEQDVAVVPFLTSQASIPLPLRGHADLFLCTVGSTLVAAPNTPAKVLRDLSDVGVTPLEGATVVDGSLPSLAAYNIAVGSQWVVGKQSWADPTVVWLTSDRTWVDVRQGLSRCSTLPLGPAALTSDGGIAQALHRHHIPHLLISQQQILLPGYSCGCLGGCCGIADGRMYVVGRLSTHPQGEHLRRQASALELEVVELGDTPLTDVGSILFVSSSNASTSNPTHDIPSIR